MPVTRTARLVVAACALVVGIEVVLWLAVAKERLEGRAWVALLVAALEDTEPGDFASCVAVEPRLYERTAPRDRDRIETTLATRGIELRIAPPTHNPPTGYLDRDCVEVFLPPPAFEGWNLPVLAKPHIAYYTYDFNGDAALMLQLGATWVHLASWNVWM